MRPEPFVLDGATHREVVEALPVARRDAGLVGQVLYLEAEEASIRSTGIGCYFDDPVVGLKSLRICSFLGRRNSLETSAR